MFGFVKWDSPCKALVVEKKRRRARPSRAAPSVHFTLDGLVWLCYPPASVLQGDGKQSEIEGERAARGGSPRPEASRFPGAPSGGGGDGRGAREKPPNSNASPRAEARGAGGAGTQNRAGDEPPGGTAQQAGAPGPPQRNKRGPNQHRRGHRPQSRGARGEASRGGPLRPAMPGAGHRTKRSRLCF